MGRRDHINLSFKTHAKVCKIYKKSFMNIHTIGFYIKYVCGYVCAPSKASRVNVVFNPTRKHEPSVRSKEEITFGGSESRGRFYPHAKASAERGVKKKDNQRRLGEPMLW